MNVEPSGPTDRLLTPQSILKEFALVIVAYNLLGTLYELVKYRIDDFVVLN